MKRLKWLILLFCLAISIPLAFVVLQTYEGLAQEERAQLRFFSEALFDEIETDLTDLVRREENRAVDAYNYTLSQGPGKSIESPLTQPPGENYILGYLQNNPDGSFQTPMVADLGRIPSERRDMVKQLKAANTIFNSKKFSIPATAPAPASRIEEEADKEPKKKSKAIFAERYLSKPQKQSSKSYLGRKIVRKEEISVGQALNLSKEDQAVWRSRKAGQEMTNAPAAARQMPKEREVAVDALEDRDSGDMVAEVAASTAPEGFQVEVAPFQSVFIEDGRFFIFRRIAINHQIYRQGFILESEPFLRHLAAAHFESQPMAQFTGLSLQVVGRGVHAQAVHTGSPASGSDFIARRTFPAPFDFLRADLQAGAIPGTPARRTLNIALSLLAVFMLLGLVAIYQSARTVVDLSERRSQFVSSVTHELKTPLTNIRMYIEMLDQGIAATPEREHDYLNILGSESARLSRLINNVLELAKLEKKQRQFDLRQGNLEDLLAEVNTIMAHKLAQEGFQLDINSAKVPPFAYDHEVMIQILINLIENSIKFGRTSPEKQITISAEQGDGAVIISVIDTGQGIPRHALKKVFDDFYRVDNDLTRTTGGTGIGLSLVKKFVQAMGGRVKAANNDGAGCTITFSLPLHKPEEF